jgi:hypothetical protein
MTRLNAILFFAMACLVVLVVSAINVFCEYVDLNSAAIVDRAAQFQSGDRGIVSVGDDLLLRYKVELLRRRSPQIEAAMFGSSTLLGLPTRLFGNSSSSMNMAVNGSTLYNSLGMAREALKTTSGIRSVFISLDWGLGFPFNVGTFEPDRGRPHPPLPDLLRDVLSTSRTEQSIATLLDTVLGNHVSLFRLGTVSTCASGEPALMLYVGRDPCSYGTLADGSIVFLDNTRPSTIAHIKPDVAAGLLDSSKIGETEYYKALVIFKAEMPINNYVDLDEIASTTTARSGRTVLIFPPMLPGLVALMEADAVAGPLLLRFKQTVSKWSSEHGIELIDMNRSEAFGCVPDDFADGHHALVSCWIKVARALHGELKARPTER